MERFALLTAAALALILPLGCGDDTAEPAARPSVEAERASALSSGSESDTSADIEVQQPASTVETSDREPSPITTEEALRAALKENNPQFDGQVYVQSDGRSIAGVGISDPTIEDITPLAGLPLQMLELPGCHVTDIGPLEGMSLRVLGLERTGVRDIGVLKGMPLIELSLSHTRVEDLSPLAGAPLEKLYLVGTKVTDLSPLGAVHSLRSLWLNDSPVSDITPLKTVPLASLTLAGTKVSDLSPLEGLPLRRLHIARSEVTDLTPLEWLQLDRLVFTPGKIEKGIESARNMRSLREIGTAFGEEAEGRQSDVMPAHLFWERYDAGGFK